MASRNKKGGGGARHPKAQGDGGPDRFVPADRADQITPDPNDQPGIVDVLELEGGGDGGGVNLESSTEGDARELGTEDGGDRRAARSNERDDDEGDRGSRRSERGRAARADDDDDTYSRRVRTRINRERAITRGMRTQLDTEIAARQSLEQRLARLEQGTTEASIGADIKTLEAQIAKAVEDLEAATEAGETKKMVALQMRLADLQGEIKVKKYDAEQKRRAAAETARTAAANPNAGDRTGPGEEDEPDVEEFIAANKHWWGRKRYQEEQEHAVILDRAILREIRTGDVEFEAYSPEHLEELGRRLKKHYPDLEVCDVDGEPIEEAEEEEGRNVNSRDNGNRNGSRGRRAPMGGMGGRNGRRVDSEVALASQGKVSLTQEDFKEMRVFNLDPNNPDHKKRYARERLRTIKVSGRGVRA